MLHTQNTYITENLCIGTIPHSQPLHQVYLVPHLSTNLLSVGQLVVNTGTVGGVIQDQDTGKVIEMGPKSGRLFPLHLNTARVHKATISLIFCFITSYPAVHLLAS